MPYYFGNLKRDPSFETHGQPGLSFVGGRCIARQLRWVAAWRRDRRVGAGRQQRHHLLIPQLLETGHGGTATRVTTF